MTANRRPLLLACLGVALAATACAEQSEGPTRTRDLELGAEVTRLVVAGGVEVSVTVGAGAPEATVTASPEALDELELTAEGDTLRIVVHGGVEGEAPRATVTLASLERIAVAAGSVVDVAGSASESLGAGVSGASTLTLTGLALRFVTLQIDGASLVAAEGTAVSLEAVLSGASTATLDRLNATDAVLELQGGSTATVTASSSLEVNASGASTVRYAIPPAQLSEYTSGGSTVGPMEG